MIVVDTNILAYLWIPGSRNAEATRLLGMDGAWVAPPLWLSEFRNVLATLLRAGKISLEKALEAAEGAEAQMVSASVGVTSAAVLDLAARSGCTAYDCEFVALASELGVPLVTTDQRLAKAFPGIARSLDEAVKEVS